MFLDALRWCGLWVTGLFRHEYTLEERRADLRAMDNLSSKIDSLIQQLDGKIETDGKTGTPYWPYTDEGDPNLVATSIMKSHLKKSGAQEQIAEWSMTPGAGASLRSYTELSKGAQSLLDRLESAPSCLPATDVAAWNIAHAKTNN